MTILISFIFEKNIYQTSTPISGNSSNTANNNIGKNVKIGRGTYIGPNVVIGDKSDIGKNCFIGDYSLIEDVTKIGNNVNMEQKVFIGTHVKIGGFTKIPESVVIHPNTVIFGKITSAPNGWSSSTTTIYLNAEITSDMKLEKGEVIVYAISLYKLYDKADKNVDSNSQM